MSFDIESVERRQGGAAPKLEPATWRNYYGFLRGLQLVENTADELRLTATGLQLQSDPTPARLAAILADRIRLFAEVLSLIAVEPLTVDEVDERIRARYKLATYVLGDALAGARRLRALADAIDSRPSEAP